MAEAVALDPALLAALNGAADRIFTLRGARVMLAQDLASLYGLETRALLQAVRRNLARFPKDFAFSLTNQDLAALRSQLVISKDDQKGAGGARYTTMAFTEQGVGMLSSVLRSDRAVAVNIALMRSFVQLRGMVGEHAEMKRRLDALEKKYDEGFREIFQAIGQLMDAPAPAGYAHRRIGFTKDK